MTAPEKDPLVWRKSSFSSNGGTCVEVAWRKSSFSGNGADCVEVAARGESAAVRDSKATDGPALAFPTPHWRTFLGTLS